MRVIHLFSLFLVMSCVIAIGGEKPAMLSWMKMRRKAQTLHQIKASKMVRRSPLFRYRQSLETRVESLYTKFRDIANRSVADAEAEVDRYRMRLDDIARYAREEGARQQAQMKELTRIERSMPKHIIDDSLQAFRRRYNDTQAAIQQQRHDWESADVVQIPHSRPYGERLTGIMFRRTKAAPLDCKRYEASGPTMLSARDFNAYMDHLSKQLAARWMAERASLVSGPDKLVAAATREMRHFQEDLATSAKLMATNAITAIDLTVNRRAMYHEARVLEHQLRALEKEGVAWMAARMTRLESNLKTLQNRVASTNLVYEELLTKRRNSMYYSFMNDRTLSKVLEYIDPEDVGWELVRDGSADGMGGVTIHRKVPTGQRFAVVRASGIIRASAEDIVKLFEDNSRVPEYNKFFDTGRDLEMVAEDTKVVWAAAPPIFPFKPRDFCTVVHYRRYRDGTVIVLNRATRHPDAPITGKYVRGQILLGANIIEPIGGSSNKVCKFTMLTQLDPGGFSPPMVVNQIASYGPINFFRDVQRCARTKPSKKVLAAKRDSM